VAAIKHLLHNETFGRLTIALNALGGHSGDPCFFKTLELIMVAAIGEDVLVIELGV
jgi:hypothetical protein